MLLRKHFGALTIALAMALGGKLGEDRARVYAALNPTRIRGHNARGWDSVLRRISLVSTLFPEVRPSPPDFTSRQSAERAAMTLASRVLDESLPITERVAHTVCHPP